MSTGKIVSHMASPHHQIAYDDLVKLLTKHAEALSALDMLAIAANLVGKLIAMQDQKMITPEIAMKIVSENLEVGNRELIGTLAGIGGRPS